MEKTIEQLIKTPEYEALYAKHCFSYADEEYLLLMDYETHQAFTTNIRDSLWAINLRRCKKICRCNMLHKGGVHVT